MKKSIIGSLFGKKNIIIDIGSWDNIEPSVTVASKGARVFAIDRYQRMEDFKEKLFKSVEKGEVEIEVAKRIHPMRADANRLPFSSESIDGALFIYSISWLEQFGSEPLNVYKEVYRVLKKEGIVIIKESTKKRACLQESFLKTQMKTNRDGTIIIGRKNVIEKSIFHSKKYGPKRK